MSIFESSRPHPGPPPGSSRIAKCEHNRLRFVWRVFAGKNQPKRYGFQCVDCGKSGYKAHSGEIFSQWVADRNCIEYFGYDASEATCFHDLITASLIQARQEFYARRAEEKQGWWPWYNSYLDSDSWQEKRQAVFARDNNNCRVCGGLAQQVHHLTYKNVGYEPLDDLVSVCVECHEEIHRS